MAVYQLENEHIYLEVASHGAELVRLVGKKTKFCFRLLAV